MVEQIISAQHFISVSAFFPLLTVNLIKYPRKYVTIQAFHIKHYKEER